MATEGEHGRIIARAAKTALTPLGFWRKGRSRLWLTDRGFWLSVVEFQPSAFRKGSYLNVAAHWLWGVHDFLSYDYGVPQVRSFIQFADPESFAPAAAQQAADATEASEQLRVQFATVPAAAAILSELERTYAQDGRGGTWPAFNAAMAEALSGDTASAVALFQCAISTFEGWHPEIAEPIRELLAAVEDRERFLDMVDARMNKNRERFGLAPIKNPWSSHARG